jgi:hypothetical protein
MTQIALAQKKHAWPKHAAATMLEELTAAAQDVKKLCAETQRQLH